MATAAGPASSGDQIHHNSPQWEEQQRHKIGPGSAHQDRGGSEELKLSADCKCLQSHGLQPKYGSTGLEDGARAIWMY
jgi:hypothetical protein